MRYLDPALIVGLDRRILATNPSFRSRYSGGEDPSGRFCFEVTHRSRPPCDGSGGRCPLDLDPGSNPFLAHLHPTCFGEAHERIEARRIAATNGRPEAVLLITRLLSQAGVGRSAAYLKMLERAADLAADDGPILIRGESGTGKAQIGRLVHDWSARANGPFVPADGSGPDPSRLEAELFGWRPSERGPVPGGSLMEAAREGTLFLREPQRLPPSLQLRLVRTFGSDPARPAPGCRLLLATEDLTVSGRQVLGGLLGELPSLLVPPLRDRRDDIPLLVDHLQRHFTSCRSTGLEKTARLLLTSYSFPGNLRELEGIVERACLLAKEGEIRPEHLPRRLREGS